MPDQKKLSDEELFKNIEEAQAILMNSYGQLRERGLKPAELYAAHYYSPNQKLTALLIELKQYIQIENPPQAERIKAGELMEQIAFLVISGLKGIKDKKSFQSVSAQYDLLVNGEESTWSNIFAILGISNLPKGILVEAKAFAKPIEDKHFCRLCNLIQLNLENSVGIGIFFTINGATGFPKRNAKRRRAISDCWFHQILFHAKTNKPILVLDAEDIFSLDKNGSLIKILERKIHEIEELTGLPTEIDEWEVIDLPPHLDILRDKFEVCTI